MKKKKKIKLLEKEVSQLRAKTSMFPSVPYTKCFWYAQRKFHAESNYKIWSDVATDYCSKCEETEKRLEQHLRGMETAFILSVRK